MTTPLARVLSVVLHPLLMPTLLFATVFYQAPSVIRNLSYFNESASVDVGPIRITIVAGLLWLLFLYTFLVPVLVIYWLHRLGFVQSLTLETRRDRNLPYLVTAGIYSSLTFFFVYRLPQLPEVALLLGSVAFSVALVAAITIFWKISAHAVGIGGVLGALTGLLLRFGETGLFWPLLGTIVLTGLVLSARLHLNAHTPEQMGGGLLLGIIVSLTAVIGLGRLYG
ncbi:MAG: hypothetical protein LH606_20685 [Cytophagaceae bacterium]|nr:hypothetical protein [Cytophagaceae bacterium]